MKQKKWGRICHISSISALENQGSPHYCASKAAVNSYVRSVGRYVSKFGIIMTAVMPGPIYFNNGYWSKKEKKEPKNVKKWLSERVAINRFGSSEEISNFVFSNLLGFTSSAFILVEVSRAITKSTPFLSIGLTLVPICGPVEAMVKKNKPSIITSTLVLISIKIELNL